MKFKFLESIAFIAVLFILFGGAKILLTNMERTSHLYDYSDVVKLAKQKDNTPDANTIVDEKKEDEKKKEKNKSSETSEDSEKTEEKKERNNTKGDEEPDSKTTDETSGDGSPTNPDSQPQSDGLPSGGVIPSGESDDSSSVPSTNGEEPNAVSDEIVSIACDWPDQNNIQFGKAIPQSSIRVTAQYKSGKTESLSSDQYTIIGLNNKVCGKRQMVIMYENLERSVSYTVNNYIVSIDYDWDTKDTCYKGEEIDDEVLYVFANMADGTEEEIEFGDYRLEGIDNENVVAEQSFTIRYKGFESTGTCRFRDSKYITETNFYHDVDYKTLDKSHEDKLQLTSEKRVESHESENRELSDKIYVIRKETLVVDGKEKPLTYKIKKRDFDVRMILDCVYDKSQNIDKLVYEWPTKDQCYYNEVIDDEVLSVYVVMEDGSKKKLSDNKYELSGIDNKKIQKEQEFTISYKGYEVSGTCTFNVTTIISTNKIGPNNAPGGSSYHVKVNALEEYEILSCLGNDYYKDSRYVCTEEKLLVDGKEKKIPYKLGKRDFFVTIERFYK